MGCYMVPDFDPTKRSVGEYIIASIVPATSKLPFAGQTVYYDSSARYEPDGTGKGWFMKPILDGWTTDPEKAGGYSYIGAVFDLHHLFNTNEGGPLSGAMLDLIAAARIVPHPNPPAWCKKP